MGSKTKGIVLPRGSESWIAKHLSYYRLNVLFFTFSPLLFSTLFYALNGDIHVGFLDSLFMCAAAVSSTGLETVLNATLSTGQQVLLCILMWMSSQVIFSLVTLAVRIHFFKRLLKMEEDAKVGAAKCMTQKSDLNNMSPTSTLLNPYPDEKYTPSFRTRMSTFSLPLRPSSTRTPSISSHYDVSSDDDEETLHEPPAAATTSRASVKDLEQRVGNALVVEYRALRLLVKIVILYVVLIPTASAMVVTVWLIKSSKGVEDYSNALASNGAIINAVWYSIYQISSGFNTEGLSLIDSSMVPFSNSGLFLFVLSFVVIAGDACYPVFLRLAIWTSSRLVSKDGETYESLTYLLDHPRRCSLYLFRSYQTWFLLAMLILMDLVNTLAFTLLDWNDSAVNSLPLGSRLGLGLFQSIMSHSGGFSVVSMAALSPAMQFLYLINFVLGAYPVTLTIRTSGASSHPVDDETTPRAKQHPLSELYEKTKQRVRSIGVRFRWQLAVDVTWIAVVLFFLLVVEQSSLEDPTKPWMTPFSLLFEVTAAYAGVGLSLGLPTSSVSLSGALNPFGKLLIIVSSIRGCLRALPIGPDVAVALPTSSRDLHAVFSALKTVEQDERGCSSESDEEEKLLRISDPLVRRRDLRTEQEERVILGSASL